MTKTIELLIFGLAFILVGVVSARGYNGSPEGSFDKELFSWEAFVSFIAAIVFLISFFGHLLLP